jgi:hypothetical protein
MCALLRFKRLSAAAVKRQHDSPNALLGDPKRRVAFRNLFRGFHLTFNPRGNHNGPPLRAVKFFHRFLSLSKTHKGVRKYYLYFFAHTPWEKVTCTTLIF